jgi:hippurate hydrolase
MNDKELKNNVIQFRRDLHRIPEIGDELPKTTSYLLSYLEKLPCTITDLGQSSFTAFFDAGKEKALAFRTDMDALPVEELSDHDFVSTHKGQMHACGHDGHMSIMLCFASEVARLIDEDRSTLNHNVLLVFQAAEEAKGGAEDVCNSGILEKYNTEKIFGLHIWPGFPKNTVICRANEFMAGTRMMWLNIDGKSSHIATPDKGIDALNIGAGIIQDLYKMEQKEFPRDTKRVFKFGQFNSGTGINIISGRTEMCGSIRFYDKKVADTLINRTNEILKDYEGNFGCKTEFIVSAGYPPVINPPELVEGLKDSLKTIPKDEHITFSPMDVPVMTSEDYSFYQERVPGLFFFLGTGMDLPLHNGYYDIDEDVLPAGVSVFKALLLNN